LNPAGSIAISFNMGSYSRFLLGGTYDTIGFDDYKQFFGNVPISAFLSE